MIIYGLKNCDTCRKALRALPDATLVDVRADGVPDMVMNSAFETFGDAMLNTRSTTWRGLSEQERKTPARALISAHPALMKRPLIAVDNTLFLGWTKEIEAEIKALRED